MKRSLVALSVALLTGCPLPYEFSGEGAGQFTANDPSSPSVTAPVQIAFSESAGPSGTIPNGQSATTNSDTSITLFSDTPNAVIYYTRDGSSPNPQGNATQRFDGAIGLAIADPTVNNATASITINALAVGPNMRPSPTTGATVTVTYQIDQTPPNGDPQRLAPLPAPQNPQLLPDQSFAPLGTNVWFVTPRPTVQVTTGVEPPDPYADLPNQPGIRQRLVVRATIVNSADQTVIDRTSFQILPSGAESSQSGQTPQVRLTALSSQLAGSAVELVFDQRLEQFDSADESWTDLNDWSPAVSTPVFTVDRYDWADYTRIVPTDADGNPGWVPLYAAVASATGNALIDLRPFGNEELIRGVNQDALHVHNNASVTIVGTGSTSLNGDASEYPLATERRIAYVTSGSTLLLDALILRGGRHSGANGFGGATYQSGGGGGAGVGGAVFIDTGATLTARNSKFEDNSATGGAGGTGGILTTFNAGASGGPGGGGAAGGANSASSGAGNGQAGSRFGGGGAGGASTASFGGNGGAGGFGGGGGGGGRGNATTESGTGGSSQPDQSENRFGGFGGNATNNRNAGGGGGAGLGGAIFINSGATLRLEGSVEFVGNLSRGGNAGKVNGVQGNSGFGTFGIGAGAAIFALDSATIVFAQNSSVNAPNDLNPSYDGNDFFTNSHTGPNENAAVYPASM